MDGDANAAAEARRLEAERVREVLEPRPTVETDVNVARKAGRRFGHLKREGESIGRSDAVIAATGLVHDQPVLTRNVADFARIPGLAVRSY